MNGQNFPLVLRLLHRAPRPFLLASLLLCGAPWACSNGGELGGGTRPAGDGNTPSTNTGGSNGNASVQPGSGTGQDPTGTDAGTGSGDPSQPQPGQGTGSADGNAPVAGGNVRSFRLLGRSDANQVLSWSASGGEFAFRGTHAQVTFAAINGNNVVGVVVDGNRLADQVVRRAAPTVSVGPLTDGNHVVRLLKLSEARLGTLVWQSYTTDGEPLALTAPSRRMAFLGDSIAAGYGVNGTAPCVNTAALEDGTKSFAYLAATALGADADVVAWAGKGLTRNDTADNANVPVRLPDLWLRANGADGNSRYAFPAATAPQVVVLAFGTNDYEYTEAAQGNVRPIREPVDANAFVADYAALIRQIEASYPQASFVLCTSPLLSDFYPYAADAQHTALGRNLQAVASQFDAQKVTVLDFATLTDAQRTGCGAHPGAAGQQALADALVALVRERLGWAN